MRPREISLRMQNGYGFCSSMILGVVLSQAGYAESQFSTPEAFPPDSQVLWRGDNHADEEQSRSSQK